MQRLIDIVTFNVPHHAASTAEKLNIPYTTDQEAFKDSKPVIWLIGTYFLAEPKIITFIKQAINKDKKVICHWIGSDISDLQQRTDEDKNKWANFFNHPNIINFAEIDYTQKELHNMGIKSKICPIPLQYYPNFEEKIPTEKSIGIYMYGRPDFYYWNVIVDVMKKMPDIQFHVFGGKQSTDGMYTKPQLTNVKYYYSVNVAKEIYPKTNATIRLTKHDGLPLGPVEFMLSGRCAITNIKDLKGSIYTEPIVESIIQKINELPEYLKKDRVEINKYWRTFLGIENIKNRLLETLKHDFNIRTEEILGR